MEAMDVSFTVFAMTWLGIKPATYQSHVGHSNRHSSELVRLVPVLDVPEFIAG